MAELCTLANVKKQLGTKGIHLNIGNQEVSYNTIKNLGKTALGAQTAALSK